VSPDIDQAKISALQGNPSVVLHLSKTPRKDSIQHCKKSAIINLRASTDDNALVGYRDIALELTEQLPHIDNIFVPTSSGATLEGMYLGYRMTTTPRLFAVQTTKVHPIASYFDKDFVSEKISHATAIVDRVAHRRDRVIKIIEETGGGGFVISNKELEEARKILGKVGWQSALAFAGFLKWQTQNPRKKADKVSVCIFTD
jgi:threonine synthase